MPHGERVHVQGHGHDAQVGGHFAVEDVVPRRADFDQGIGGSFLCRRASRENTRRGPCPRSPQSRGPQSRGPQSWGPQSRGPQPRAPQPRTRCTAPAPVGLEPGRGISRGHHEAVFRTRLGAVINPSR
ncbi:hypothetical protein M885DRAFT_471308, partial [Pelagophyceae sp. CCMP2097]